MKKDCLKCLYLFVSALTVALILYPLLHESGHCLAAMTVGAEVTEFHLFPSSYIVCEVSELSCAEITAIGLAGPAVPLVFSELFRPKSFLLRFCKWILRGMNLISLLVSVGELVLYRLGIAEGGDDLVRVAMVWEKGFFFLLSLTVLCAFFTVYRIAKEKIVTDLFYYFEYLSEEKAGSAE